MKTKFLWWVIAACVISLLVIFYLAGRAETLSTLQSAPTPTSIMLNGQVSFDGSQFIIENNNSFNWYDAEFRLNSRGFDLGYTYECPCLLANSTYTVGAMQFTKSDGTRFNPFTTKPLQLLISCETLDGKKGYLGCGW